MVLPCFTFDIVHPNIGKNVPGHDIITGVAAGETAETTTDPNGNVTLKINDRAGRIKSASSESRTTVYEYYDNGNKKSVQYQDGSRTDYTYYKDNLLNTLISKKSDGAAFESYSYAYDAAGNRSKQTVTENTTVTTTEYTYNNKTAYCQRQQPEAQQKM